MSFECVTSACRNPERNERTGGKPASRHMPGRALDVGMANIPSLTRPRRDANGNIVRDANGNIVYVDNPTFDRGVAFYKAWEVIHGPNPTVVKPIPNAPTANGPSASVPWADFWQLEDRHARPILKSNAGFVLPLDAQDNSGTGIPDGYERSGHLHMQDDPNVGVHL